METDGIGREFDYIVNCLHALNQKQYRTALKSLDVGLRQHLQSAAQVDGEALLKHISAIVSYLEFRLEEDFGFRLDDAEVETRPKSERRCSFCASEETDVQLIAGPEAFICAECVKKCAALIN